MNLTRRAATEADYEYAKHVHDVAYREWTVAQFGPWNQEVQDKFFDESWQRYNYEIFLLDDQPCGYCAVDFYDDEVRVREFAVDPEFQGEGIGTAFLDSLITQFHSETTPVRLNAFKANTSAIGFYLRYGFTQTGESDTQLHFEWRT